MEIQAKNTQICRLCLENEMDNGGFLVEIFSSLINEPGKMDLSEKIRELFGLKIFSNDGLPHWICHKCLVLTENCMEFRDKCLKNDEKLRLIFKVNDIEVEAQEPEAIPDVPQEEEIVEEEDEEVITLNPNKLYESSDESESEMQEEQRVLDHQQVQPLQTVDNQQPEAIVIATKAGNDSSKKEIYHCRYCDVVFSDPIACSSHELKNHDQVYPYECVICSFKTEQHATLIFHIKQSHNVDKPFLCTQCTKSFIRRSDLRKHTFVHAGIRLYSCDICSKSFTRNTNLTKHKRTHSEKSRTYKCTLCPKAFYSNSELSRHVEIHMDRKSLVCKYCNQAFIRRDLLEFHQKSHLENNVTHHNEASSGPPVVNSNQPKPIVFYNQPQEQLTPMNFYTENSSYNVEPVNAAIQPQLQPKSEYPIMNQLLSGISLNQNLMAPVKNFVCGICKNAFFKKKELDRHVITIHTNIQQFKCESCSKTFNRKDKLLRHEKIHLLPPNIFNCSFCPAVFVRKQMLEIHSKIHEVGNGHQIEPLHMLSNFQPLIGDSNGFTLEALKKVEPRQLSPQYFGAALEHHPLPEQPPALFSPMNLSMNKNPDEPMDLSNDRIDDDVPIMKLEPIAKITIDSDEEEINALHIVEEPSIKKSPSMKDLFNLTPQVSLSSTDLISEPLHSEAVAEIKPKFEEELKGVNDISFPMVSRIADLDKLEPLRDLPMEILNND